jgi:hypothetical protein
VEGIKMKNLYLFTIVSVLALSVVSCNVFSSNDNSRSEDFRFVEGEVLLELEDGHTSDELDSLLTEYEIEGRGTFFPGNLILVPEGEEKKWAEILEKEEMIHSAHLNRFGYDYKLLEEDELPYLKDDSIYVWTVYSGCEPGNEFTVEYIKTGASSFEIWLFKEEHAGLCATVVGDKERSFKIPDEIKDAKSITLIQPINGHIELKN